ncbi:MAG TPA: glycosyltransferase 87 family protein [Blastocatellia bacterium]|nr:glycosyltransferase 87 family protein [Blastocatellia bacterium]
MLKTSSSTRLSPGAETTSDFLSTWAVPVVLVSLGLASASLYYWARDLHRFTQWIAAYIILFIGQFGIYLVACHTVLRRPAPPTRAVAGATIAIVIVFAALFRAELVAERPYLTTDTYRYIWDGRVQSAGINPYRYIPSAEELKPLRDGVIYPQINRGDYAPTPYPPLAQAIYFAVYMIYPSSVTAFKTAMSLFDLLTALAVMLVLRRLDLDPARAIIFAWHPVLIFESAHSGHVEAPFIAFLALALLAWAYRRPALTGVSVALAAMIKFYPAVLLPVFFFNPDRGGIERSNIRSPRAWGAAVRDSLLSKNNLIMVGAFILTVVLAYLPYWGVGTGVFGSLPNEFREEGFVDKGGRYFMLVLMRTIAPIPTTFFLAVAALALGAMGVWQMVRTKRDAMDVARASVALIGFYILITTPRYSWYYAWILPFLCFVPSIAWIYLTGASVLLYLLWYVPFAYPDLPLWLGASLYLPTLALLVWNRGRADRTDMI